MIYNVFSKHLGIGKNIFIIMSNLIIICSVLHKLHDRWACTTCSMKSRVRDCVSSEILNSFFSTSSKDNMQNVIIPRKALF